MVNHFASLLANLDMTNPSVVFQNFILGTSDTGQDLVLSNGKLLGIPELQSTTAVNRDYSVLINKDYNPITLPVELKRFYDIIFPANSSNYHKQFLLYCYLRLIDATNISTDVKLYDNRVSYVLDELADFFHTSRLFVLPDAQAPFQLLVSGNLSTGPDVQSGVNRFVVQQVGDSSSVLIYSLTDHTYLKFGKPASQDPAGMEILLDFAGNVSAPVAVGGTGLSISLTGDFGVFNNTSNKSWFFDAEAPLKFDLTVTITELETRQEVVGRMLDFAKDRSNISYENIWNQHFNSVYRFAGLLLAYVERVNSVWHTT